jgi:hypothetical protein
MAVAFDAVSVWTAQGTGELSLTHTPTGTPRGAIAYMAHTGTQDEVTGITYGGVAMTRVGRAVRTNVVAYAYFLGANIPTGAQSVVASVNATGSNKRLMAFTVTAATDTEVNTSALAQVTAANPSVALTTTAPALITGTLTSGNDVLGDVSPGSGMTQLAESFHGSSIAVYNALRRTTNPEAGATSVDWTAASENQAAVGFAISEVVAVTVVPWHLYAQQRA